ncbi:MAG: DapH/DapD/GlmU-related protein [Verrucomicrobiota bacterium]
MLFFQNKPNGLLKERNLDVHSDFTPWQWTVLAVFWVLLFPVFIPLWIAWRILIGAFVASGIFVFWMAQHLFIGHPDPKSQPFKWQFVRAYINNCIAVRLPHYNWKFRKFLFRLSGVRIGKGGFIGMGGYMEDYRPENVVLEDNVTVSFGVTFIAHGKKKNRTAEELHIILRSGAYIGAASVLIPGIEIGRDAVVGGGAVVTKDVPAGAIVAGSPARILGYKDGYGPSEE